MSTKAVVLALWSVGLLTLGAVLLWMNHSATWGYDADRSGEVRRSLDLSETLMVWSVLGILAGPLLLLAVRFHARKVRKTLSSYPKTLLLAAFVTVFSLSALIYNVVYWMAVTAHI
ncbi:MAG: hypothetical protein NXI14_08570 [bacterium]|nr:hypothetical protein [bacterium]